MKTFKTLNYYYVEAETKEEAYAKYANGDLDIKDCDVWDSEIFIVEETSK